MKTVLKPSLMGGDLVQLDVVLEDVPPDLFGVSFHLASEGDWYMQNYVIGDAFNGINPLVLMKEVGEPVHKMVAGLSMRRGNEQSFSDGTLMTLYVVPGEEEDLSFSFDHAVASTFDGQARRDLEDAEFVGADFVIDALPIVEETTLQQARVTVFDSYGSVNDAGILSVYMVIACGFLLVFLSLLVARRFLRKKE